MNLTPFGYLMVAMLYLIVAILLEEKLSEGVRPRSKSIILAACWPGPVVLFIWLVASILHI